MKCQILFKGQIKTNVTNLSTAELAERVVRIKISLKKKKERWNRFYSYMYII